VSGNRAAGLFAAGVETTIVASVVRDTGTQESNQSWGFGIVSGCDPDAGVCGSLRLDGSVVARNQAVGVLTVAGEATIASSVVRDTQPEQGDQTFGQGIQATCYPALGRCGSLRVEGSLVTGNRDVGISVAGVDTTVLASVVRDTQAAPGAPDDGRGINVQCDPEMAVCGRLEVAGSLVTGSRAMGIAVFGAEATVRGSVVRGTPADSEDPTGGRGIDAQCDAVLEICGSLAILESLVENSQDTGVFAAGVPASLEGVAVLGTRANASGPRAGLGGQGVFARCHDAPGGERCATLALSRCRVSSSHAAGVAIQGVSGFLADSVVEAVSPQPADDRYGYGVQVGGVEGAALPAFNVARSLIRDARLAGILYYLSTGTLHGSIVSGGEYSVLMNEGSSPTILEGNDLSGTRSDEPRWISQVPSPAPPPAVPVRVFAAP
jgi:hypothetical protein